jgi:hypothetical protein|tara:strand:+ start:1355 stop:1588 length:234 start_codon:yes stop_codon:yes gene_type:complete
MKTIYDRLKPSILASINKDEQEYPYTTKALKEKLKKTTSWDELTIGDIRSVVIHSHIKIVDIQQEDILWGDKFLINE